MSDTRLLIVNADDFGLSPGINRGIIEAHEHGILTSASLMVRWAAAKDAAAFAQSHPRLGVGLHVDLGEMIYENGQWRSLYEVLPPGASEEAIRTEIRSQLERFQEMVGRPPSHLDSHQHCHRKEPVRGLLREESARLGVPLRDMSPGIRYCGAFYGQSPRGESYPECVGVDSLIATLEGLPLGTVTELGCHPAATVDFQSVYRNERLSELATLCDERVRTAVTTGSLQLISFQDLPPATP